MALRSFRQIAKDYFTFSGRHRRVILALLLLLGALAAVRFYLARRNPGIAAPDSRFRDEVAAFEARLARDSALAAAEKRRPRRLPPQAAPQAGPPPAPFDPHTADAETWLRAGLDARLAARIVNYVAAGGRFRKKEDLRRIYGMREADFLAVEPYLLLPPPDDLAPRGEYVPAGYRKTAAPAAIDLNKATADELAALRGIGPARAQAILDYRARLGGYLHTGQLREVYGIDSALFDEIRQRLTVGASAWGRVNINARTEAEFRHPYLTPRMARLILNYRAMHGPYRSTEDLRRVEGLDTAALNRLFPYLVAGP
jgi:competence ComEA-like helix-hairpin-helix protein